MRFSGLSHVAQVRLRAALLLVSTVLFVSACGKNDLAVTNKNFEGQVELQQNLVLEFSHPLVADSLVGAWDTTRYVNFQPAVQGSFKWTSPTTLVFSPAKGFRPSTTYKAELTESLLTNAAKREQKRVSLPSEKTLDFHTPYLALSSAETTWIRAGSEQNVSAGASNNAAPSVELRIDLAFNYNVSPQNLAERLQISAGGRTVTPSIKNTQPAQTLSLTLPLASSDGGKQLQITLGKGLRCVESEWASPEEIKQTLTVPSPDEFKVSALTTDYDDDNPIIRIVTSQSLYDADVKPFVSVQPQPKNFSVEAQENGIIVRGAFMPDSAYQLTVSGRLRGLFGKELGNDYTQTVNFGTLTPTIAFTEKKAMYLSTQGGKNIGVKLANVPRVEVIVEKIYENNLLAYTRNGKQYGGDYDEATDQYNSWEDYPTTEDYGDVVLKRVVDVRTLPKSGGIHLLNLDFQDKLQGKGLYVVRVVSTDQKWLRDSRIIAVSDLALLVKETDNDMFVMVNSIKTAEAVSGAEVRIISRNNQVIGKVESNKDGIAKFSNLRSTSPGAESRIVTASLNGETTYLMLQDTRVETSRYDVGGLQENSAGLQAFIYGDRDMYRPGETAHFNVVVRNLDWSPAAKQPVKIKVILPTGKDYTVLKRTLNDEGAVENNLPMPTAAMTGAYPIEVYTANDVLIGTSRFNVEEFLPDRISVNVNLSSEEVKPGSSLTINATALNLFGPPAANRNYDVNVYLKRKLFTPKGFDKYNFAIQRGGSQTQYSRGYRAEEYVEDTPMEPLQRQGVTGADGTLTENVEIPAIYRNIGLLQGRAFVTVYDENGRAVARMKEFTVPTQDVFLGIQAIDRYQTTRQSMQIPIVATDKNGKLVGGVNARVRVIRHNWITVLERDPYNTTRYRYVSQKQEITELERMMSLGGGSANLAFTPRTSGEYEVRVALPDAGTSSNAESSYVSEYFYAYGWGDTQASSFEVSKEGEITIESEKTKYSSGETANLLFKTPFAGKLIVTVERNGVLDYFTLKTDQKSAKLALPIKDEYTPNIYVVATLVKPLDDGAAVPLTVAYGYHPLTIEKSGTRLNVSISAPQQVRSKTKQTITVQTNESDVEMTIAAVDEGILQLRNFQTPDPYGFFYQKRALQVDSYSVYPLLFPDLKPRSSSAAGDAAMSGRVNPMANKRVKLVTFWSGIVKASGGKASTTIDIPEFSGALRIMAVAYKGKNFGSAEATMRVADPIVISSGLPRFLSPGDETVVPVTLTNTTQKEATAQVQITTEGAVSVVAQGEASASVSIPANSEKQVFFKVMAGGIGQAAVNVAVSGLGEKFTQRTDLVVRPVAGLVKYSGSASLKGGEGKSFQLTGNFMQGTARGRLVVSKSPIAQFSKNLSDLVQYPYGCVEQTVSSVFPQLYVGDLAKSLQQNSSVNAASNQAASNIQEAIRKLASMQLYNGSLSYWQGGAEESWWGSAYGAHFLMEAQKAGYEVGEQFQSRLYGYLSKKVKERNYEWYGYYDRSNALKTKYIPAKTIFYSLYVLALANKADFPTMNYYKANKDSLALDSRYLLASAYFLAGDKASYRALLPKALDGERATTAFDGSFYSYIRDEAISLNALLEVEPENPQIGIMAKHLSEQLITSRYLNTQENAVALVALGKIARGAAASTVQASISANGKQIAQFTGTDVVLSQQTGHYLAGQQISITSSGQGTLYYFWDTQGLSSDGSFPQEDSFIQVRRTFLTRDGKPLSPDNILQNDLVVVKITLVSLSKQAVSNVAITDMLPAGLEIENPRVGAVPELGWIKDNTEPSYLDIRDDRINFFVNAGATPQHYYYLARAVSKGVFKLGPVSADAMYNGEYHSYNGAGVVRVVDRVTGLAQ